VYTLATGRVGNGKIMANMIRYLQYQAMQRRAGRRKKRKERWKVEMETLTLDQLLCRILIEDWPTPQGGHSPELVYDTMQEYQRVEEELAKTTELKDNRYISKNRESPVHLHVARMLGVHRFAEHPPGAWQCPYCGQQRFREYSEWEFHVRQVHLKERIVREEAGDFWTWLFRWIGQYKSWPRVMDVFRMGATKYTFRRMSEEELEGMWADQSEVEEEELRPTIKTFVEEVDRGLRAADRGDPFTFNSSTTRVDDEREIEVEDPIYRLPPEQQEEETSLKAIEEGERNDREDPEDMHRRLREELWEALNFPNPSQRSEHMRNFCRRQRELWKAMDDT
jgi:hypothetical protein